MNRSPCHLVAVWDFVLAVLLVPSMIGMIVFAVINRRSLTGVPPQWCP